MLDYERKKSYQTRESLLSDCSFVEQVNSTGRGTCHLETEALVVDVGSNVYRCLLKLQLIEFGTPSGPCPHLQHSDTLSSFCFLSLTSFCFSSSASFLQPCVHCMCCFLSLGPIFFLCSSPTDSSSLYLI